VPDSISDEDKRRFLI
jgi:serine/threonine protein kinase